MAFPNLFPLLPTVPPRYPPYRRANDPPRVAVQPLSHVISLAKMASRPDTANSFTSFDDPEVGAPLDGAEDDAAVVPAVDSDDDDVNEAPENHRGNSQDVAADCAPPQVAPIHATTAVDPSDVTKQQPTTKRPRAAAGAATAKPKKVAPVSGKASAATLQGDACIEAVMAWFDTHGKPGVAQSIVDALGSKYSKLLVQRALDALLLKSSIRYRDIKKIRVYCPVDPPPCAQEDALSGADGDEAQRYDDLERELRRLQGHTSKASRTQRPIAEVRSMRDRLSAEATRLQGSLDRMRAVRAAAPTSSSPAATAVSSSDVVSLVECIYKLRREVIVRRSLTRHVFSCAFPEARWLDVASELGMDDDDATHFSLERNLLFIPPKHRRRHE